MSIQTDAVGMMSTAAGYVDQKWQAVQTWLDDYGSQLISYLEALAQDAATTWSPNMTATPVPTDDVPVPDLSWLGGAPTPDAYPTEPSDIPDPVYPGIPAAPSYTMPELPDMHEIIIPDMIPITIPQFMVDTPVDYSSVPNPSIINGGEGYNSQLLDATRAKLLDRIVNGGTGLDPDIEDAIFARETERATLALADAAEKLAGEWAKRGFTLPSGSLAEQMTALHTEYMDKRLDTSRDIAIKQAELEQKNISESLTQANDIEGKVMDATEKIARRIFDWSKATADASIEICKTWIAKYNAQIEGYKAEAQVFVSKIQAESLKVELYKNQIQAQSLIAQIDTTLVERYKAQLQGVQTLLETYKTEMEAVKLFVETEREKVETYKARVEAFTSRINAINTKYTGLLQGYKTKVDGYVALMGVTLQSYKINKDAYAANLAESMKAIESSMQAWVTNHAAVMKASETAATVAAAAVQAAMAGVSIQAHISGAGSASESYSESKTMSA